MSEGVWTPTEVGMDPELRAMVDVVNALSGLTPEGVGRVLRYVTQRLQPGTVGSGTVMGSVGSHAAPGGGGTFEDIAGLFDAARPLTGTAKALVVAYFHQVVKDQEDFDSFTVNTELKNLGHPSKNITRDLDGLIARRLVMQTRKEGKSRQARKRYKLTREGIKRVERMLVGEEGSEEEE